MLEHCEWDRFGSIMYDKEGISEGDFNVSFPYHSDMDVAIYFDYPQFHFRLEGIYYGQFCLLGENFDRFLAVLKSLIIGYSIGDAFILECTELVDSTLAIRANNKNFDFVFSNEAKSFVIPVSVDFVKQIILWIESGPAGVFLSNPNPEIVKKYSKFRIGV